MICDKCKKPEINILTRCGHVLHDKCIESKRDKYFECPQCLTTCSNQKELEEVFFKIRSHDLNNPEVKELYLFLEYLEENNSNKNFSYNEKMIENLQRLGWDINNSNFGGEKLFDRACVMDYTTKVDLLIDCGIDLEKNGARWLKMACLNSSFDTFNRLIKMGFQLDKNVIFELVPLKRLRMLDMLLKEGLLDVNFNGNSGKRPIHAAVETGSIKTVLLLIKHGANFNAVDNFGRSILFYVRSCEIIKYLLESGFDFTVKNNKRMTPLFYAINIENHALVEYLIKEKAGINICDENCNTPLHHLIISNVKLETLKILIENGADVNAKNNQGKTPLQMITEYSINEDFINLLLDNGAEMNVLDKYGKSPFYFLNRKFSINLKKRFIDGGAYLSIINRSTGDSILEFLINSIVN